MDLPSILALTLLPDPNVRQQAERELQSRSHSADHLQACLGLIGPLTPPDIQLAALIHVKNSVRRGWESGIQPEAKDFIKGAILELIALSVDSPSPLLESMRRNQLLPILDEIIQLDIRLDEQLVGRLFEVVVAASESSRGHVYTLVFCIMCFCRYFRWHHNKTRGDRFDSVVQSFFPDLVTLGALLVDLDQEVSHEILKHVLKCYKFATYSDLPAPLQVKESASNWAHLMLRVISAPSSTPTFVKCQKWAAANLSRVFLKYGVPGSNLSSSELSYPEFRVFFLNTIAPEATETFFKLVSDHCMGKEIAGAPLCHILSFLDTAVKIDILWSRFFVPNLEPLVGHFLFGLTIVTQDILLLSEEDPMEYIHCVVDIFDREAGVPDIVALNLVTTLAEIREEESLSLILRLCQHKIEESTSQKPLDAAKTVDAVFRTIGAVSHIILNPKMGLESEVLLLLQNHAVPALANQFAFFRTRALELLAKFLMLECSTLIDVIYQGTLLNLFSTDTSSFLSLSGEPVMPGDSSLLPAQAQAALTFQAFLIDDEFRDRATEDAVQVMQTLLGLSRAVDLDMLSGVMQEVVEHYAEQLQPFGRELMSSLAAQVMGVFEEEEDPKSMHSERILLVNGVLNTMITVLLSFETTPQMGAELEKAYLYVVETIFDLRLDDFYTEAFELLESSMYLSKSVLDQVWHVFSKSIVQNNFKHTKRECVILTFLTEAKSFLKYLVMYGWQNMSDQCVQDYYDLLIIVLRDGYLPDEIEERFVDEQNLIIYYELASYFILLLKQRASSVASEIISRGLVSFQNAVSKKASHSGSSPVIESMKSNVCCMIIAGLVYLRESTLAVLGGFEAQFFESWTELLDKKLPTKRVFYLKLSILGLVSLIAGDRVGENTQKCFKMLAYALKSLPAALNQQETRQRSFEAAQASFEDVDRLYIELQFGQGLEGLVLQSGEFLSFLKAETERVENQLGGYEFVEETEDAFMDDDDGGGESPLDVVDVAGVVRDTLRGLDLSGLNLSEEEVGIIQSSL